MGWRSELSVPRDPLDALTLALGLRFYDLSKRSAEFRELLRLRSFSLQFSSKDGKTRTYLIDDGQFSQVHKAVKHPDLALNFKTSLGGAKLLIKGDSAALIAAIQSGELESTGDFALLLWFALAAKHLPPKTELPAPLNTLVSRIKPLASRIKRGSDD